MEIHFDRRNYRKHGDKNKKIIHNSLKELGAGRSILIDNDNEIIGGNGVFEQAQKLGIKTKVIETDGSELVVVKRTDLNRDDPKRKKLALADNSSSDSSEFDIDLVIEDFDLKELDELGVKVGKAGIDTSKIDVYNLKNAEIAYEPNGNRWDIKDLYEFNHKELVGMIDGIKDKELKEMLKIRVCWLAEFRYDRIADYYCNQATKEEQEIFEKLALVLLDKGKMIQNGYSELMEFVKDGFKNQES